MENEKLKKKALEIARRFPESIKAVPRWSFEEQLADFIIKEKIVERQN